MHFTDPIPHKYFARYDESDDQAFYATPRLTAHLDQKALAALSQVFAEILTPNSTILDLMSSYRSHVPPDLPVRRIVGLGMNEEEMRLNPQLDAHILHDLNREPRLPFDDASFDAVLCSVSIQYMTRPVAVFAEVGRILQPGGPFIVSFSNRCFPSKAVHIWLVTNDRQRGKVVQTYFESAQCFTNIQMQDRSPQHWLGDRLYVVIGRRKDVL